MRHRETNSVSQPIATNTSLIVNQSSTTVNYSGCPVGSFKAIDDVNSPRYASRRNRGEIVMNPVIIYKRDHTSNPKSSSWIWSPATTTGQNYGFSFSDVLALRFSSHLQWEVHPLSGDGAGNSWDLYARDLALTSALSKVNNPSTLTLVSLKEWRQTSALLSQMLALLKGKSVHYRKIRELQRQGKLNATTATQEISNLWLTGRYGVQPLLYDMIGILEAFDRGTGQNLRETSRAYSSSNVSLYDSVDVAGSSSMIASISLKKEYWQHPQSFRAGVLNKYTTSLRNSLGLTLGSLPLTAWEATRLSFVADWFVNTGEWLSALTATSRADILGCYVTGIATFEQRRTYSESGSVSNSSQSTSAVSNGTGASIKIVSTRKTRWILSPSDIVWGPKIQLSTKRLADACALISSNFRR